VIKYIGSKRRLVPAIGTLAQRAGAGSALDLFTGTTRVAQELKRGGAAVWAVDLARYSEIFARCYIQTDAGAVDAGELEGALAHLNGLPGREGYFTETFCRRSRFFQPFNGRRVDAIRDALEDGFMAHPLYPVLLTSLIEAADRVDSTTGVQMAYLKSWAPRSFRPLELLAPELLPGPGHVLRADAVETTRTVPAVDLAYLDPPYNQHRYYTNYHVWETLVAWDAPEPYGLACKRVDARDPATKSPFNSRATMATALAEVIAAVRARVVVVSFSNEGWVSLDDLVRMCSARGAVRVLSFDSKRYVGAQIGIHNLRGEKVGRVSHLRNVEHLILAGDAADLDQMVPAAAADQQLALS
jgi:adenine-specific DNA-methyltransferase